MLCHRIWLFDRQEVPGPLDNFQMCARYQHGDLLMLGNRAPFILTPHHYERRACD